MLGGRIITLDSSMAGSSTNVHAPRVSFYGLNVTLDTDPLCYFRLFLDDSVIERIVVETNRYAEQTDSVSGDLLQSGCMADMRESHG